MEYLQYQLMGEIDIHIETMGPIERLMVNHRK